MYMCLIYSVCCTVTSVVFRTLFKLLKDNTGHRVVMNVDTEKNNITPESSNEDGEAQSH